MKDYSRIFSLSCFSVLIWVSCTDNFAVPIFMVLPLAVRSIQVKLSANDNLDLLVERAGAAETKLVDVPVNTDDWLLGEDFFI